MKNLAGSIFINYPLEDTGFGIKRIVFGGGQAQRPFPTHSIIHQIVGSFSISIPARSRFIISMMENGETNNA